MKFWISERVFIFESIDIIVYTTELNRNFDMIANVVSFKPIARKTRVFFLFVCVL